MGWRRRAAALVLLVTGGVAVAPGAVGAQQGGGATPVPPGGTAPAEGAAVDDQGLPLALGRTPAVVTLITGDRVTVRRVHGVLAPRVDPGPGRDHVRFQVDAAQGHLWVIPSDAVGLVGSGRVDRRLFDVAALVADGYDDAQRGDVPLIIQPVAGAGTPDEPATPAPPADPVPEAMAAAAGGDAAELPAVGVTAVSQPKDRATEFWEQVATAGDPEARTLGTGVGAVWLDGVRRPLLDESVPQVRAPEAWAAGFTGAGVRVAVLDSGVDVTHPDLAGRVVESRNFSTEPDADDLVGHGTHVASIVGGTGSASGGARRGVAPDAALLNGKVCDVEVCYESDILAGMSWAVGADARVVNMSLGGIDQPGVDPLEAAINTLSATEGTLFVVAAGNDGDLDFPVSSPASADAALAVGAVDGADQPAGFSSRGPRVGDSALKPEITAPGVGIAAAQARNGFIGVPAGAGYVSLDGTSMATPHVAAAAAIVAQQHPDWPGSQIKAHLVGSADRTPGIDAFTQGAGRLDAGRAVSQVVSAEPAAISGGLAAWPHDDDAPGTHTVTYRNPGAEPVTLALAIETAGPEGPSPDGMFALGADAVTVPAGGEATVELTVDTAVPAAPGHHSAWVTATADGPAGDTVVTTPVAVDVERESYELTVELRPREGEHASEYGVFVAGLDAPAFAAPWAPEDTGTTTVRLPRGRYGVAGRIFAEFPSTTEMLAPEVVLDRDRTVVFDGDEAARFDITLENTRAEAGPAVFAFLLRGDRPGTGMLSFGLGTPLEGYATGQVGPAVPEDRLTSQVQAGWAVPGPDGDLTRSDRVYELAWVERGRMVAGRRERVRDDQLAAVQVTHRAIGPGRFGYTWDTVRPVGGEPILSVANLPYMPLPHRRTMLFNTRQIEWAEAFDTFANPDEPWEIESHHAGDFRRLRRGNAGEVTWNQAVLGPVVSRSHDFCGRRDRPSRRAGDVITVNVAVHGDGTGNPGCARPLATRTTLLRDGEVVGESDGAGSGEFTVPPEAGDYRLEVDDTRQPDGHLSTRTTAAWTFRSARVEGEEPEPLPLLAARFTPPLDEWNRARAGTRVEVPVAIDRLGAMGRVGTPTVEASFDDGATWSPVPVRRARDRGRDRGFVATVHHPTRAGFVSLRATARDDRGNAVEQTTIRAYELTTAG